MFLIDGALHWSASDLTAAVSCEYGLLRTLDVRLGRIPAAAVESDPLMEHIARLGDRHEEKLLAQLELDLTVAKVERLTGTHSADALQALRVATREAFESQPDVVYQAGFSDGEFFGYADFIEQTDDGWVVCDAKLARSAKPKALLQLGAYADQLLKLGLPLAAKVSLLLGNGDRADFPVADILPIFRERRERLRTVLTEHQGEESPAQWGDKRFSACGSCAECAAAIARTSDVLLVAGLRLDQRRKLRAAGIETVGDLASATSRPADMTQVTFDKLQNQAALQWQQLQGGEGAVVTHALTPDAAQTLRRLPAPSKGDLFFDFEGDPLYDEGDPRQTGLEYLWGVMDCGEDFKPLWAHSWEEEKAAFISFMEDVAARRAVHPDLHIYHYAPYETTALKRLAMRYQTHEQELDEFLRAGVFVDLYSTVRGAVRISAPSYSIKKLEPLYMGDELRDADGVQAGDASILAYNEFRQLRDEQPSDAKTILDDLESYNRYDCLSTLRLRDWLLERAEEAGVRDEIVPRIRDVEVEQDSDEDPLFLDLLARTGPIVRTERTAEEQAYAMLANAIDYNRRERKIFWWEHFARLERPLEDWCDDRDVFVVESAEVTQEWAVPEGKARNARRKVRLSGDWGPGSTATRADAGYREPWPIGTKVLDESGFGFAKVENLSKDELDPRVVVIEESRNPEEVFSPTPVALVPPQPPNTKDIDENIRSLGQAAVVLGLPLCPVVDVLLRRPSRLRDGAPLPQADTTQASVVGALLGMDDSYVAIQGPPGTGKSYTGAHVIQELVEKHHWRVGVVGPSHAVVENLLQGIIETGLARDLVGKSNNSNEAPTWTVVQDTGPARAKFLRERESSGCVIGGTAWTFASHNLIADAGLDLLVIDEAGQFSLAMTLGSARAAQRLLLLGDPQQLPQVSQGTHAEPVNESALGWLLGDQDTIPASLGYFLGESFRMHPALCAKVSTLSYDGRLVSAPKASNRDLDGLAPGLRVVNVSHEGNRAESPEEAAEVVRQVQSLLGKLWRTGEDDPRALAAEDFLVVAPYNAQVALIRQHLVGAGLGAVRVGTVDKFQGQEAPVAIVSMTASSHGDVPRGMGFLLNRNRVNVAVSRAQWLAILVRSTSLTAFMPSSVDGVLELGGFIGLCDVGGGVEPG